MTNILFTLFACVNHASVQLTFLTLSNTLFSSEVTAASGRIKFALWLPIPHLARLKSRLLPPTPHFLLTVPYGEIRKAAPTINCGLETQWLFGYSQSRSYNGLFNATYSNFKSVSHACTSSWGNYLRKEPQWSVLSVVLHLFVPEPLEHPMEPGYKYYDSGDAGSERVRVRTKRNCICTKF